MEKNLNESVEKKEIKIWKEKILIKGEINEKTKYYEINESFEDKSDTKKYMNSKKEIIKINDSNKKDKNNIKKRNEFINNRIIHELLILNIFIQILSYEKYNIDKSEFSTISLKINGTGYKEIFCSNTKNFSNIYYPNKVKINGNEQLVVNHTYYFNQTDNFVEIIWNRDINKSVLMFYRCTNITKIDLSNFDGSKIIDMRSMFYDCLSLTSLNFSNFKTTLVQDMDCLFRNCTSLISVDLSGFDISKCKDVHSMFYECSSLVSVNLSNFDTSNVKEMQFMFYNCLSLTSLDLSYFKTSKVTNMNKMFYGCINLEYINMINFQENQLEKYNNIFNQVPENIVVCVNENYIRSKILPILKSKNCYVNYCSDDWKMKQKKIITANNICKNSCEEDEKYKYEYNGKCYENCPNGFITDDNNLTTYKCKCELEKCEICPPVALKKG